MCSKGYYMYRKNRDPFISHIHTERTQAWNVFYFQKKKKTKKFYCARFTFVNFDFAECEKKKFEKNRPNHPK